MAASLRVGRAA
jgi:hypothetical protein